MREPAKVAVGCEANQVGVQACPGAVFLNLRRKQGTRTMQSMFIEMTIGEASRLLRALEISQQIAIDAM